MKKKFLIIFLLLFAFLLNSNLISVANASGCAIDCNRPSHPCGLGCEDCPWCSGIGSGEITNPTLSDKLLSLTGSEFFSRFISNLITLGFIIAVLVALFLLLAGGIKWITSSGDKAQLESARKTITSAVIGLVIVLCTYAVLRLIGYFFHIDLIVIDISNLIL